MSYISLDELREAAHRNRIEHNKKLRYRYQLARDLGFSSEEARLLSFKNEKIIIKLARERDGQL